MRQKYKTGRRVRWGLGGDSGRPDTPVGTRRRLRCRAARGSSCSWWKSGSWASNSWGNRPNWAMETQGGLDHVQRQDSIGSKPQTTHQIDRSIRKHKIGAIFVIFVFGMEITKGGRIRGNRWLLIPYGGGYSSRGARSSRILSGG